MLPVKFIGSAIALAAFVAVIVVDIIIFTKTQTLGFYSDSLERAEKGEYVDEEKK